MNKRYYYSGSRRGGIWSFIGYLSFGILGILLGAVLVYGLFVLYLIPEAGEPPLDIAEEESPLDEEIGVVTPGPEPFFETDRIGVVEKVMPAVVGVNSHQYITRFGERQFEEVESGSGVIISADGYIVTNQHVIENAEEVTVVIPGMGRYEAEVVGADSLTDLALLRIEETGLTYMPLGDSEQVRVGESVLAIGNPLGLQQTVTAGIISAVNRQVRLPGTEYAHTFIQTDALVNPGNSGGPLVNMNAEIIGINTAKVALIGVEGIGLSIPSNTVKRVIDDFKEYGKVLRPHLGVLIEDWIDFEEKAPEMGIHILEIVPGSPADQAGLMPGDVIAAVNRQEVKFLAQLFDRLLAYYPGDTVKITFYRDGEQNETDLTLGERPETFNLFEPEKESGIEEEQDPEETENGNE